MLSGADTVLTLDLDTPLRVADEVVEGTVLLNFKELQNTPLNEVHVKLRGSVFTRITRSLGNTTATVDSKIELARETISLWQPGTIYPLPGEDVLKLPFSFRLPSQLLPSCEYKTASKSGVVAYSIEVVGDRPGLLHSKKRIMRPLPILPHNIAGAQLRNTLRTGWAGEMRSWRVVKNIRKGIWGEYSNVTMLFALPALETYPVFVPIPFTITIITISKTMRRDEVQTGEPIFPTPPYNPKDVEVKLMRKIEVKAGTWNWKETGKDKVAELGGFGGNNLAKHDNPSVEIMDNVWIPATGEVERKKEDKKQKGTWQQEVTFRSTTTFKCPPSFTCENMTVSYHIEAKATFPGIGNDLKNSVPIEIISSMLPPGSRERWDGPPPDLDLPPTYLSATDWNHDEKSG